MNLGTVGWLRPLWLAVAVVVAFIGHDVLMATSARSRAVASDAVSRHSGVVSHARSLALPEEDPPAGPSGSTGGSHLEDCDTARSVVQPPRQDPDLGRIAGGDDGLHPSMLVERRARAWWREPTAPPGVRRALFQVYRV